MHDLGALTGLMAESLLAHIEGSTREAHDVLALPFGNLRLKVLVQQVMHEGRIAQQHVWLHGGVLGLRWIEDNFAGMGESAETSVVHGAHDWVASSYQAIRAALGPDAASHSLTVDGIDYDVYTSPRTLRGRGAEVSSALAHPLVLRYADVLPVLYDGPSFVSSFVARGAGETIEIKVDGSDWPARDAVGALPWPAGDDYASVRELSVLMPRSARSGWPSARAIRSTLERLPRSESGARVFCGGANAAEPKAERQDSQSPQATRIGRSAGAKYSSTEVFGVKEHRWRIDPPLEVAPEGVPDDYAWFVTQVSASGAGPGYGLLSPVHEAQASLREGVFDGTAPRGVVALGHHGCGAMALLVCGGPHHGEVWIDAEVQDAGFRRIAGSFREHYLAWLLRSARREPAPRVLDPAGCAMPRALSSFLESLKPGADAHAAVAGLPDRAVATTASADAYFDEGDNLDLCIGCWDVGTSLGLQPRHVVPGIPPKQGRNVGGGGGGGWPGKAVSFGSTDTPKKW